MEIKQDLEEIDDYYLDNDELLFEKIQYLIETNRLKDFQILKKDLIIENKQFIIDSINENLINYNRDIIDVKNSLSYKIGVFFTYPFRIITNIFKGNPKFYKYSPDSLKEFELSNEVYQHQLPKIEYTQINFKKPIKSRKIKFKPVKKEISTEKKKVATKNYSVDIYCNELIFNLKFYKKLYSKELSNLKDSEVISHWLNKGIKESEIASPFFSIEFYKSCYDDLSVLKDNYEVINHYIKFGEVENRVASPIFSHIDYSVFNPDIYYQYKFNKQALKNHFINHGIFEGRQAKADLNLKDLLFLNNDLNLAFGKDYFALTKHYLIKGNFENRDTVLGVKIDNQIKRDYDRYLFNNDYINETIVKDGPMFSIIIPVYNIDEKYLKICIDSVTNQTYKNWELILVDDKSPKEHIVEVLNAYKEKFDAIKVVFKEVNENISKATNDGLKLASGDYIAFMDNDDELNLNALNEFAYAIVNADEPIDLLYSDEDKISANNKRSNPVFKRGWSPASLLSFNYLNHLLCVKSSIIFDNKIQFNSEFDGCQDFDFIHSILPYVKNVIHVPKILYYWRTLEGSVARSGDSKQEGFSFLDKGKSVLKNHLCKKNSDTDVFIPKLADKYNLGLFSSKSSYNLEKVCFIVFDEQRNLILEGVTKNIIYVSGNKELIDSNEFYTIERAFSVPKHLNQIIEKLDFDAFFVFNGVRIIESENNEIESLLNILVNFDYPIVSPKLIYNNSTIFNEISFENNNKNYSNIPQYYSKETDIGELGHFFNLISPTNTLGLNPYCFVLNKKYLGEVNYDADNFPNDLFNLDFCLDLYYNKNSLPVLANNIEIKVDVGIDLKKKLKQNRPFDFEIEEINSFKQKHSNINDPYYNINLSREHLFKIDKNKKVLDGNLDGKKILCFTHNFNFEGAPIQMLEILIGLKEKTNAEYIVVSLQDGPLKERFIENGFECYIINSHHDKSEFMISCNQFKQILKNNKVDLIIANTLISFLPIKIAKIEKIPSIWIIHESYKPEIFFSMFDSNLKSIAFECFNYPQSVVFVAKSTRDLFNNYFPVTSNYVVNNAIFETKAIKAEIADSNAKKIKDDFVFLNLGSVCERKGQIDFVNAGIQLIEKLNQSERVKLKFVLVGCRNDNYQLNIEKLINASKFVDNFVLISETKDVQSFYNVADVFVCSSYNESYPKVILEAMQNNLPIISTDVFGIKEQIIDNFNGLFYEPGDTKKLKKHMNTIYKNDDLRKELIENVKKSKNLLMNFETMVLNYINIIKNSI